MSIPGSFHQQYPVVVRLSEALSHKLGDAALVEAYSLSREELVLVFQLQATCFTFKIIQRYRSCFLLFENQQPEKGSNAQPCFTAIAGSRVQSVEQHLDTRSFSIHFSETFQLVFKLYDALVNVVLYEQEKPVDLFRKNIARDWETPLQEVARGGSPQLQSPAERFYIYKRIHLHPYYFTLEPCGDELVYESVNVMDALHEFSRLCLGYYYFDHLKQSVVNRLQDEIRKLAGLIARTREGLKQLEEQTTPEEIANIIMANLHSLESGLTSADLYNFYHDQPITVRLKKELNPQQNAAYYYRKAKNSRIETEQLQQKLVAGEQRMRELNTALDAVVPAGSMKELKPYLPKEKKQQQQQFPFRQFECDDFLIWVGKSAANNDELTMKHAHKNDLWLHAKDVSGSHVIIKWKAGQEYPPKVIARAAGIAAYYSKLKGSTLVPVSYTLKKFVRKPKGAEPGAVVVDKEEVIMVEPRIHP